MSPWPTQMHHPRLRTRNKTGRRRRHGGLYAQGGDGVRVILAHAAAILVAAQPFRSIDRDRVVARLQAKSDMQMLGAVAIEVAALHEPHDTIGSDCISYVPC